MEIDKFTVEDDGKVWELYFGRDNTFGSGKHGFKLASISRDDTIYAPDEEETEMILERLNGFPKAMEFLYELRGHLERAKKENAHRTGEGNHVKQFLLHLDQFTEHVDDFLSAVPHKHTKLKQEEPKPREFYVTIKRSHEAVVSVVATSKKEAAELVWEQGDLIGDAFAVERERQDDTIYDEKVSKVEEA